MAARVPAFRGVKMRNGVELRHGKPGWQRLHPVYRTVFYGQTQMRHSGNVQFHHDPDRHANQPARCDYQCRSITCSYIVECRLYPTFEGLKAFGNAAQPIFLPMAQQDWQMFDKALPGPGNRDAMLRIKGLRQREIGHRVIGAMMIGALLSYYLADPFVAVASVVAFLISETADWLVYTWSKRPLPQRIVISSAVGTPLDSAVFLAMIGYFSIGGVVLMTWPAGSMV